ncbi:MAG: hypothetical protein WD771_02755 [Gemmatimonadaceae bacterium]
MRLELAERLRCPAAHTATALVVVATRLADRELVEASVGCPVCRLEARVQDGDVVFPDAPRNGAPHRAMDDAAAGDRLIALLGLAEPGGAVLLTGRYIALAAALAEAVNVAVMCLGAPPPTRAAGVSAVHAPVGSVPFTDGTFRAAALDAGVDASTVREAVRTVSAAGRVVGALPLERPPGVSELARDGREWVGERDAGASGVVPLRRA